jgi:hypothetical protein
MVVILFAFFIFEVQLYKYDPIVSVST